ncbi:hypothetical protein BLX41_16330 [Pseudomonas protegens]|uniref:hypothetical protein n=1 Tax=Pseudomonas protegens TaxID=380021 RepID=UPI000F4B357B|nr:hypothetical protein [Pseudomonas protegens]ROL75051.1 hypothetical protein BLX41_16330 [Pseudomonas protegens]
MSSVGGITNGSNNLQLHSETSKGIDDDELRSSPLVAEPAIAEGVKVSLSGAGLQKSSSAAGDDRDIEESGLPENIQNILKMIRKLQQQIAEKLAQLQAIMADKRLSPEEAKIRIGSVQSALAALNSGLLTANASLAKAMKDAGLSPEQVMKAASLIMRS